MMTTAQRTDQVAGTTGSQGRGAVGGGLGPQFNMQANTAMNLTNMHSLGLSGISSGMNVTGMN